MPLPSDLVIFQPISALLILLMGVFGGVLPYWLAKNRNLDKMLSYLNCASGGVLIGVALLHIFPETGETMNGAVGDFPMSYCITFIGIVLMVLVLALGHDHQHGVKGEAAAAAQATENGETKPLVEDQHEASCDSHEHEHDEEHHHHAYKPGKNSIIMLMIGLLIHDLSEGMVLGLQTEFDSAMYLSIAILLHKWCDVSVQVVTGIRGGVTPKQNFILCLPLVLATPLTQIISYAIVLATTTEGMSDGLAITQDFFMSFACGTFLAIVFIEIFAAELMERAKKECVYRTLAIVGGFLIICISSIVEATSGV